MPVILLIQAFIDLWYTSTVLKRQQYKFIHSLSNHFILQVHLQTQQDGKISAVRLTINIVKQQGILALYSGLSASLLRQLTYSTARFGLYEVLFELSIFFQVHFYIVYCLNRYRSSTSEAQMPTTSRFTRKH